MNIVRLEKDRIEKKKRKVDNERLKIKKGERKTMRKK